MKKLFLTEYDFYISGGIAIYYALKFLLQNQETDTALVLLCFFIIFIIGENKR